MTSTLRQTCFALALVGPAVLFAHEFASGDLSIDHPWAAPPPPGAPSVAGYLSVINNGARDDRLIGATAGFTEGVEMHESRIENDVVRMRELVDGVVIPAGQTVEFAPTGKHLMFVSPEPLLEGDVRLVTLQFEHAGEIEVQFNIEQPADDADTMDHSAMEGMNHAGH